MELAKKKRITPEMRSILKNEFIHEKQLILRLKKGIIVIIPNRGNSDSIAFGDGLRSKILCNLGTSTESPEIQKIIEIAKITAKFGANIICDQSTGPDLALNRQKLLKEITLPLASIPLYQNAEISIAKYKDPIAFKSNDVIKTFLEQVKTGISAPGFHPVSKELVQIIEKSKRVMPYVSRGGTILSLWIKRNNEENPYLTYFDEILEICTEFDVPITFVSATRSGCLADGFDDVQKFEWKLIRRLIKRAHSKNVSVIVDGIGHLRIDQIPRAVKTIKKITFNVPLGVMGPATTDRALGYEHISHAIGASVAIQYGANYCQACCRTEHLGLPELPDVIEALSTYKIATYIGDLSRIPHLNSLDRKISIARKRNEWGSQLKLAIEPIKALEVFKRVGPKNPRSKGCAICGDLCPFILRKLEKEVI